MSTSKSVSINLSATKPVRAARGAGGSPLNRRSGSLRGARGKSVGGGMVRSSTTVESAATSTVVAAPTADEKLATLFSQIAQIRGQTLAGPGGEADDGPSSSSASKPMGGMARRARLIKKAKQQQQQHQSNSPARSPGGHYQGGAPLGDRSLTPQQLLHQQQVDEDFEMYLETDQQLNMLTRDVEGEEPVQAQDDGQESGGENNSSGNSGGAEGARFNRGGGGKEGFVVLSEAFKDLTAEVMKIEEEGVHPACMKYVDEGNLKDPSTATSAHYVKAQLRALTQSREYGLDYHKDFNRRVSQLKVEKSFQRHRNYQNIVNYVASNAKESLPRNPQAVLMSKEARVAQIQKRGANEDQDLVSWYNSQIELRHTIAREQESQSNEKGAKKARQEAILHATEMLAQGKDINTATTAAGVGGDHHHGGGGGANDSSNGSHSVVGSPTGGGGPGGLVSGDDVFSVITKKWLVHCQTAVACQVLVRALREGRTRRENDVFDRQRQGGGYLSLTLQERARYWAIARRVLREYIIRYKRRRYGVATNLLLRFLRHRYSVQRIVTALPTYRAKVIAVQRQIRFFLKVREARRTLLVMQWIKAECSLLKVNYHLLAKSIPDESRVTGLSLRRTNNTNNAGGQGGLPAGSTGGGAVGTTTGVNLTSATLAYVKDRRLRLSSNTNRPCMTGIRWVPPGGTPVDVRYHWACLEATKLIRTRVKEFLHYDRQQLFYQQEKVRFALRNDEKLGVPPPRKSVRPIQYLLMEHEELRQKVKHAHMTEVSPNMPVSSENAGGAGGSGPRSLPTPGVTQLLQRRASNARATTTTIFTEEARTTTTERHHGGGRRHSLTQGAPGERLSQATVSSTYRKASTVGVGAALGAATPLPTPRRPSAVSSTSSHRSHQQSKRRKHFLLLPAQLHDASSTTTRTMKRVVAENDTNEEDYSRTGPLTGGGGRRKSNSSNRRRQSTKRRCSSISGTTTSGTDDDRSGGEGENLRPSTTEADKRARTRKEGDLVDSHVSNMFGGRGGMTIGTDEDYAKLLGKKSVGEMRMYLLNQDSSTLQPYHVQRDNALFKNGTVARVKTSVQDFAEAKNQLEDERAMEVFATPMIKKAIAAEAAGGAGGLQPLPESPRRYPSSSSPLKAATARGSKGQDGRLGGEQHLMPAKPSTLTSSSARLRPRDLPTLGSNFAKINNTHSLMTTSSSPRGAGEKKRTASAVAIAHARSKKVGAERGGPASGVSVPKMVVVVTPPRPEENLGVNVLLTLDEAFSQKRKQMKLA